MGEKKEQKSHEFCSFQSVDKAVLGLVSEFPFL